MQANWVHNYPGVAGDSYKGLLYGGRIENIEGVKKKRNCTLIEIKQKCKNIFAQMNRVPEHKTEGHRYQSLMFC